VYRVGSHVIQPTHHRIVIPDHNPRLGTFSSILRAIARQKGIARDEILAELK